VRLLLLIVCAGFARCEVPDCNFVPGWQQFGPRRSYEGESLYEYMNGNSEGYLIYGFRKMTGVTCKKGGDTVHIDISDMGDPEAAYGIFAANRDIRSPAEQIGMGGQVVPRKAIVAKDRFYLEISAEPDKDHSAVLREMAKALAGQVPGRSMLPDALAWFPAEGLQPGSPRLIPQSVLGIRLLTKGYVAQYGNGAKAFAVSDVSPESAAVTLEKLKARFASPEELKAGECGIQGVDRYLGRMALFRKGRYIAGYANIPALDPAVLAATFAAKLP
jgi:hypothetical protein